MYALAVGVGIAVTLSIVLTAVYLNNIRKTLWEMAKVQKALAARLGAKV